MCIVPGEAVVDARSVSWPLTRRGNFFSTWAPEQVSMYLVTFRLNPRGYDAEFHELNDAIQAATEDTDGYLGKHEERVRANSALKDGGRRPLWLPRRAGSPRLQRRFGPDAVGFQERTD